MKRMALVMLVGALFLALIGGVAGAVTVEAQIVCGTSSDRSADNVICKGTNNNDQIHERNFSNKRDNGNTLNDTIYGKDGGDTINAKDWTNDTDKLYGQDGADKLTTDDGDNKDLANGGPGHDICNVDKGDTRKNCEEVNVNPG